MDGLIKWDPFRDLANMHRQLDEMVSGFWGEDWPRVFSNIPAMDVYTEDDKRLVAEVHTPGFSKEDIDISVREGILEIKGQKQEKEEKGDKKRTYMMRQSSSQFFRRIALPKNADADNVKADFKNGLLKVEVPFKTLPKPKRVEIQAGK